MTAYFSVLRSATRGARYKVRFHQLIRVLYATAIREKKAWCFEVSKSSCTSDNKVYSVMYLFAQIYSVTIIDKIKYLTEKN